jgi:acetyl-CoA acetyltransferase family protein
MTDALILSAARTPIGRARKGSLAGVDAYRLAEVAVSAVVARSGVLASELDDLILAESLQGGGVIGRNVAVRLGMTALPGVAVNRHCASGIAAVQFAAATIMANMGDGIIAGGTESASTAPGVTRVLPGETEPTRWVPPSHVEAPGIPAYDMSVTVGENTARLAGITREQADAWAARSHQRAVDAIAKGFFEDEIVPVPVEKDGVTTLFATDEHPRAGTTVEVLAGLKVLHPELPGAVVTAGNSSGVNDAAAALLLGSPAFASARGLAPLGRILGWASVGVEVERTGLAPTLAIPQALKRCELTLEDVDLFEINEAFASMAVACTRQLGLDEATVNVNGSGISLGHPVAATGARLLTSILHELARRDARIGVVAMCAGGGMGSALVVERF